MKRNAEDGQRSAVTLCARARLVARSRRRRAASSLLACCVLFLATAACTSPSTGEQSDPDEPISECETFLASYEHCLSGLGPPSIAHARIEQTRAGFAAIHGKGPRAALRKECAENLTQLKSTCR